MKFRCDCESDFKHSILREIIRKFPSNFTGLINNFFNNYSTALEVINLTISEAIEWTTCTSHDKNLKHKKLAQQISKETEIEKLISPKTGD
jgi:hypothetical protein